VKKAKKKAAVRMGAPPRYKGLLLIKYYLDSVLFETSRIAKTGAQIKADGGKDPAYRLFLTDAFYDGVDKEILDSDLVSLKGRANRFYCKEAEPPRVRKDHIIDPGDSQKAVCGEDLSFQDVEAGGCVDCHAKLRDAYKALPAAVTDEIHAKMGLEDAQDRYQRRSNARLILQRLVELGIRRFGRM
jgi:hypothetical protein